MGLKTVHCRAPFLVTGSWRHANSAANAPGDRPAARRTADTADQPRPEAERGPPRSAGGPSRGHGAIVETRAAVALLRSRWGCLVFPSPPPSLWRCVLYTQVTRSARNDQCVLVTRYDADRKCHPMIPWPRAHTIIGCAWGTQSACRICLDRWKLSAIGTHSGSNECSSSFHQAEH